MSTKSTIVRKPQCAASVSCAKSPGASEPTTPRPSPERILAFIEGSHVSDGIDDVIDCIISDADCRAALSFVVSATATESMSSTQTECPIRQSQWSRRPFSRQTALWRRVASILDRRTRLAERVASVGIDAIAAESGENSLVFKSAPGTPAVLAWRTEIALPPIDTIDAPLDVRVSNRSGKGLPDGTFTICGVNVAIFHGRGALRRKDLVDGLATGGVSFAAKGGVPVSGTPIFGSLE